MDSSCVIIGTIDVITIGGVTVAGTLGGGTVTGTLVGSIFVTSLCNIVVYVFSVCMVLNIFANLWMACYWLSLIMKGFLGPEFFIICNNSLTADSDPFPVHCTILVLHVFPKFYAVLVFRVLKLLYLVVQGVFLKSQMSP